MRIAGSVKTRMEPAVQILLLSRRGASRELAEGESSYRSREPARHQKMLHSARPADAPPARTMPASSVTQSVTLASAAMAHSEQPRHLESDRLKEPAGHLAQPLRALAWSFLWPLFVQPD
jgi:hypothetical protein